MVDLAVKIMLGAKLKDLGYGTGLYPEADYVAVKVPVFSFEKIHDLDVELGPEMKSTGEVLGIAHNFQDALFKGLLAAGYKIDNHKKGGSVIITVRNSDKQEAIAVAEKFEKLGFDIYATAGTANLLNQNMIATNVVKKVQEGHPNIVDLLESGKVDYIISTSEKGRDPAITSVQIRRKAIERSIACLTSIDTAHAVADSLMINKTLQDVEFVDITKI